MPAALSIEIWVIDLTIRGDTPQTETLSPAEIARSRRFAHADDRRRFLSARAARRDILGGITGEAPAQLEFGETAYGKPFLVAPSGAKDVPFFNQTASGALSLLAVSWHGEVGVDLEQREAGFPTGEVEKWAFDPIEQHCLAQAGDNRDEIFWRIWTRKEALLKAMGTGLHREPRDHRVCPPAGFGTLQVRDGEATLWLHDLSPVPNYAACVAVPTPDAEIVVRRYPDVRG